jgi:membrane protein DedA with SNARE-associated domain
MDLRRFSVFTLLGVIPWCLGLALAGKALGAQWQTLEKYFIPLSVAAGIVLVGAIVWWVWSRRRAAAALIEGKAEGGRNGLD